MNPNDFPWTESQQVTVINPDKEDFRFKVHGKEYQVGGKKKATMPGFIAWMYTYEKAVAAAQKDGNFEHWNEEGFRQTYYERFYARVHDLIEVQEEEGPALNTFDEEEADDDEDSEEQSTTQSERHEEDEDEASENKPADTTSSRPQPRARRTRQAASK